MKTHEDIAQDIIELRIDIKDISDIIINACSIKIRSMAEGMMRIKKRKFKVLIILQKYSSLHEAISFGSPEEQEIAQKELNRLGAIR